MTNKIRTLSKKTLITLVFMTVLLTVFTSTLPISAYAATDDFMSQYEAAKEEIEQTRQEVLEQQQAYNAETITSTPTNSSSYDEAVSRHNATKEKIAEQQEAVEEQISEYYEEKEQALADAENGGEDVTQYSEEEWEDYHQSGLEKVESIFEQGREFQAENAEKKETASAISNLILEPSWKTVLVIIFSFLFGVVFMTLFRALVMKGFLRNKKNKSKKDENENEKQNNPQTSQSHDSDATNSEKQNTSETPKSNSAPTTNDPSSDMIDEIIAEESAHGCVF